MAKRANGEGSIYPHGIGRWAAAVTHVDETGSRRRTTLYGKTQKEVRAKRDEALSLDPPMLMVGWVGRDARMPLRTGRIGLIEGPNSTSRKGIP
jgi:hypothetical protein